MPVKLLCRSGSVCVREIPLVDRTGCRPLSVQVDDVDYELASQYRWLRHVQRTAHSSNTYARRMWYDEDGRLRQQYLHNFLTGWAYVDHEDHNGLNCQRYNMRQADDRLNHQNMRSRSATSRFKGVAWAAHVSPQRWQVHICDTGRQESLGLFYDEVEAAHVYDDRARELFGEFACLNFPEGR